MIYLAKILPVFLLPLGSALALLLVGLVWRKKFAVWAGIVWLYLFSNGITAGFLMRFAEAGYAPRSPTSISSAQAVVVLSGMLDQRPGLPLGEWADGVDRFEAGLELLQAGKAPVLVFTGGQMPWKREDKPEGEILRLRATRIGIPREKIMVTRPVGNTAQEAEAVKEVCGQPWVVGQKAGGRNQGRETEPRIERKPRIILVTSAFHMRRAKFLFERQGFEVEPFPVDFQDTARSSSSTDRILKTLPRAQFLLRSETALRELLGMAYYSLRASLEAPRAKT